MRVLAQGTGGELPNPSFTDNLVLDQYEIPFGPWMEQMAYWITLNLKWLLSIVEWPFKTLLDFIVGDVLEPISWVWVVLIFFVVGSLVRNIKIGAFAALGLGVCGILGNAYWLETTRTIGYIGVAVLLCVIIGVPLGIACGRIDSVWQVTRPVLDAMQVVHSFVYMLPFIWWFGVGEVSATMVTMVFALPPLVRLTNLGIRQVPADVVEASRAYGAPERRVLIDVQIPLARPAIMTGINQTLLLAISMLGIAAIMGAGGLGRLLFNAINLQDVAKGAASGLAFFLVAVVLDRISQGEGEVRVGLWRRIRLAWAHRRDPEALLPAEPQSAAEEAAEGSFATVTPAERTPIMIAAVGGLLTVLSVFLTWSSGAGFISAYGRRADEDMVGQSFNGFSASGGSWFGFLAFGLGLFVVAAAVTTLAAPGRGPRWWTADGAVIASLALLVMMICYLLASPSDLTAGQSNGLGVYLALIGALVTTVGSLRWIRLAPHSPIHPLSARVGWGRVVGSIVAALILGIGAISAWSFDDRPDERAIEEATAELQAQIDAKEAEAEANPQIAGFIAVEISTLREQFNVEQVRVITDGISGSGPRLGVWTFLAGLVGLAVALPAAGAFGRHEHRQWEWSAATAGVGAGIVCVAFGWIFTHVRSADDLYLSGAGSFLAMVAGCVLAATTAGVLKEFRRSKVYTDVDA